MDEDNDKWRLGRIPDLLDYEDRASNRTTQHTRTKSKIGHVQTPRHLAQRADVGAEIMCIRLAVAQMTRGEFETWLALKEGVLFDPLPKRCIGVVHGAWTVVKPPAKRASVEQTARHYHRTEQTVERYDREARRLVQILRERAGLSSPVPRIPIWPSLCTDENLLRFLFKLFEED